MLLQHRWLRLDYVFCCDLITFWLCSVTVGYILVTFGYVGYGWLRFGYVLVTFWLCSVTCSWLGFGYVFVTFWLWLVTFWFRSGYILCAWGATWLHLATFTFWLRCIRVVSVLVVFWLCFGCVLVVFGYGWLPLVVFGYKHAIGYVLASFWLHSVTLGYGLWGRTGPAASSRPPPGNGSSQGGVPVRCADVSGVPVCVLIETM